MGVDYGSSHSTLWSSDPWRVPAFGPILFSPDSRPGWRETHLLRFGSRPGHQGSVARMHGSRVCIPLALVHHPGVSEALVSGGSRVGRPQRPASR